MTMILNMIHTNSKRLSVAVVAAFCLLAPSFVAAQETVPGEAAPVDYRGKVTLAYGIVFSCVVIYIVMSIRRNAGLREEVAFLEQRLNELEGK